MALLSLETLTQSLRHFFLTEDNLLLTEFTVNTDLFASGMLDSLNIVEFVIYLEEILDKDIPLGEFTLASIKSVSSVYDHYVLG